MFNVEVVLVSSFENIQGDIYLVMNIAIVHVQIVLRIQPSTHRKICTCFVAWPFANLEIRDTGIAKSGLLPLPENCI